MSLSAEMNTKWFSGYRYTIQQIFDPIQTHAVYGVSKEDAAKVKATLKSKGCSRFRTVKAGIPSLVIVCFKAPKEVRW